MGWGSQCTLEMLRNDNFGSDGESGDELHEVTLGVLKS